METYKLFPTKDGGFIRKALSKLTTNEKLFVARVAHCDHHIEADRLYYQRQAQELLFNQ